MSFKYLRVCTEHQRATGLCHSKSFSRSTIGRLFNRTQNSYQCASYCSSRFTTGTVRTVDTGATGFSWRDLPPRAPSCFPWYTQFGCRFLGASPASSTDVCYLATELAAKGNLLSYLERMDDVLLPERGVRRIFLQLLNTVVALHRRNIVHRDIKPENIVLTRESATDSSDIVVKVREIPLRQYLTLVSFSDSVSNGWHCRRTVINAKPCGA